MCVQKYVVKAFIQVLIGNYLMEAAQMRILWNADTRKKLNDSNIINKIEYCLKELATTHRVKTNEY